MSETTNNTATIDEALNAKPNDAALATRPEDFPAQLQAVLLIYDIPSNVKYPNPSGKLRRIGFRENKSCWVLPAGQIPHTLIHEMRTKGRANVEIIRFDVSEGPRLCRLAVDRMNRELAEQVQRAREAIERARDNHLELDADLADNASAREDAVRRYEQQCKWVLERVRNLARDVEIAIKNFGVNPTLLNTVATRDAMTVLQTGYQGQAAAYVAATAALRKIDTPDAQALADAAEADQVPPQIIEDMLRDHDKHADADALKSAFDPDADVYDLTDAVDDEEVAAE